MAVSDVGRTLLELKGAGYSGEMVKRVLRRAEKEAWCDLRRLRPLGRITPENARALSTIEDVMEIPTRKVQEWAQSRTMR